MPEAWLRKGFQKWGKLNFISAFFHTSPQHLFLAAVTLSQYKEKQLATYTRYISALFKLKPHAGG